MGDVNVTSNLFYDLVSIQYHALKGQEVYGRYIKDAQGQQEIVKFFEQVREQDIQRAEQCHRLLTQLSESGTGGTGGMGGGTAEPYPTDQTTGQRTGQTTGSNR
ncbi:MAG TPA: hypothetical protein VNQ77_08990 [Frankiaceae bacterium]|nr:hypothetical protein [Frankiaceae bacterium]